MPDQDDTQGPDISDDFHDARKEHSDQMQQDQGLQDKQDDAGEDPAPNSVPAIMPSVGRVVHYYPPVDGHDSRPMPPNGQPLAAHIAHVWSPELVNLMVIDVNGSPFNLTSVPLMPGPDLVSPGQACWMSYQVGQAARTELLEDIINKQEVGYVE